MRDVGSLAVLAEQMEKYKWIAHIFEIPSIEFGEGLNMWTGREGIVKNES